MLNDAILEHCRATVEKARGQQEAALFEWLRHYLKVDYIDNTVLEEQHIIIGVEMIENTRFAFQHGIRVSPKFKYKIFNVGTVYNSNMDQWEFVADIFIEVIE